MWERILQPTENGEYLVVIEVLTTDFPLPQGTRFARVVRWRGRWPFRQTDFSVLAWRALPDFSTL